MEFSVAELHEAIAASRPDAECLVFRDRRLTWAEVTERTRRLANHLISAGLGVHTERADLAGHESGQDHLAIYLHNGNEYLEAMLGAFKARVAPFNVNYRYVAEELRYLLDDAERAAIVVHSAVRPDPGRGAAATLPEPARDPAGAPTTPATSCCPARVWYEDALAGARRPSQPAGRAGRPTTSTSSTPAARRACPRACCGATATPTSSASAAPTRPSARRRRRRPPTAGSRRVLAAAVHARRRALDAFRTWNRVAPSSSRTIPERLDPADIWRWSSASRLNFLLIVGDAFARPLLDELEPRRPTTCVADVLLSGGAPLSAGAEGGVPRAPPDADDRRRRRARPRPAASWPTCRRASAATTGTSPSARATTCCLRDLDRVLEPGDDELGWLAKSGRLPLGYLGDAAKTARTYPVDRRRALRGARRPGPAARRRRGRAARPRLGHDQLRRREDLRRGGRGGAQGTTRRVRLRRRRPPERAVGQRGRRRRAAARRARPPTRPTLLAEARTHIARYKLPKAFVFVDKVVRSPSGKADYRWARQIAAATRPP